MVQIILRKDVCNMRPPTEILDASIFVVEVRKAPAASHLQGSAASLQHPLLQPYPVCAAATPPLQPLKESLRALNLSFGEDAADIWICLTSQILFDQHT